jgi:hypothetical protein
MADGLRRNANELLRSRETPQERDFARLSAVIKTDVNRKRFGLQRGSMPAAKANES